MEAYKQYLCQYFNDDRISEDGIYGFIKDDSQYKCNFNEEGKLHSNYNGSYYEPAISRVCPNYTILLWLFNGEIKDCIHPFCIIVVDGKLCNIQYYSSRRIQTDRPLLIAYKNKKCTTKVYNMYYNRAVDNFVEIFEYSYEYKTIVDRSPHNDGDRILFTPEFYPLCDPINTWSMLKFAD